MAFNFFGKRDKTSDDAPSAMEEQKAEELAAAAPPPPEKRGFFDRMRQAVTRTRETIAESLGTLAALTREVDESTLQLTAADPPFGRHWLRNHDHRDRPSAPARSPQGHRRRTRTQGSAETGAPADPRFRRQAHDPPRRAA